MPSTSSVLYFCHGSTLNWNCVFWIGVMHHRITLFAGAAKGTGTQASHRRGRTNQRNTQDWHSGPSSWRGELSWFKVYEEAKIVVQGTLLYMHTLTWARVTTAAVGNDLWSCQNRDRGNGTESRRPLRSTWTAEKGAISLLCSIMRSSLGVGSFAP